MPKGAFTHAFSALHRVFEVLALISPTNVITRKTQHNSENAFVNGLWQLGLISFFNFILAGRAALGPADPPVKSTMPPYIQQAIENNEVSTFASAKVH